MNTTTTTIESTKTQNIVAVSKTAKQFITDQAASFSAPSKSKEDLGASQREIVDAMHNFVEKHRYSEVDGVEVDGFEVEVMAVLALRGETVRANTASAKLEAAHKELEELRARLAQLQA